MHDIYKWSEGFSMYIWNRLAFVYSNPQVRLYETTITDELIFQFSEKLQDEGAGYVLQHATNEKRNGNDLEIAIAIKRNHFLIFPIQAKRMYGNRKYQRINHKGQLQSLLAYAQEIGGIPLYLLYNYYSLSFEPPKICGLDFRRQHYGCTLVNANYIEATFSPKGRNKTKWKIPQFEDLHPNVALPWHLLFHQPNYFQSFSKSPINSEIGFPINYYSEEVLVNMGNWKPVVHQSDSSAIQIFADELRHIEEESSVYSPRFRIVLNPFKEQ